jgi:hypothetical protein
MANLCALGMKSLAVHEEIEGGSSARVEESFRAVGDRIPKLIIEKVEPKEKVAGPWTFYDMNVSDMNMSQSNFLWAVDIEAGYEGAIDKDAVKKHMAESEYCNLPEPIRPKTYYAIGYTMNLAIVPTEDKKHHIIKAYEFAARQKPSAIKSRIATGRLFMIDNGETANKYMGVRVFQHMFERLGGLTFVHWEWPSKEPGGKAARQDSDDYREKRLQGFRHIQFKGPNANNLNQMQPFWQRNFLTSDVRHNAAPDIGCQEIPLEKKQSFGDQNQPIGTFLAPFWHQPIPGSLQ